MSARTNGTPHTISLTSCRKRLMLNGKLFAHNHLQRRGILIAEVLQCTNVRQVLASGVAKRCNLAFCDRDLTRKYGFEEEYAASVRARGEYEWTCPHCRGECLFVECEYELAGDECQLISGRRKREAAAEAGPSTYVSLTLLQELTSLPAGSGSNGIKGKAKASAKSRKSDVPLVVSLFDSDLSDPSDLDEGNGGAGGAVKAKGAPKWKTANGSEPARKKARPSKAKAKSEGKSTPTKSKATKSDTSRKTKSPGGSKANDSGTPKKTKPKLKPKPKVELIVEPPVFERLETRLGREEAEHRIQVGRA